MGSARVLIIDDESSICDGCRMVLEEEGHLVQIQLTGRKGLDLVREGKFDLVLLDMKLPDLDGMEILKAIRREKPEVYVIIMTGYSTVQNAVQAMKLGAVDYLAKPFSDDQLLIAVERAIEKKRLVDENLFLRKEVSNRFSFGNIVGENPTILNVFDRIRKVASTESTVLITGESGTGKELFARSIHAQSQRATKPFVAVDSHSFTNSLRVRIVWTCERVFYGGNSG